MFTQGRCILLVRSSRGWTGISAVLPFLDYKEIFKSIIKGKRNEELLIKWGLNLNFTKETSYSAEHFCLFFKFNNYQTFLFNSVDES